MRGAQARLLKAGEQEETSRYQIEVVESQINEAQIKTYPKQSKIPSSQVDQAEAKVPRQERRLARLKQSFCRQNLI